MINPYSAPEEDDPGEPDVGHVAALRGSQIITMAMAGGVMLFGVTIVFIKKGTLGMSPNAVSWTGVGIWFLMFIQHTILAGVVGRRALSQITGEEFRLCSDFEKQTRLLPGYRSQHIVACAILEGTGILNGMCYLLTDFAGNLVLAILTAVLILLKMPTMLKFQWWAQDKGREIEMR